MVLPCWIQNFIAAIFFLINVEFITLATELLFKIKAMANDIGELFKDRKFIFKIIAAILCIIGAVYIYMGVIMYNEPGHIKVQTEIPKWTGREMGIIAVDGYLLIAIAFIAAYVFDSTHEFLEKSLFLVGAVLNIITGILLITVYTSRPKFLGMDVNDFVQIYKKTLVLAITTLICGVVMLIDSVLQFLDK